ncbi:glycosyltransferase family 2 protein [Mucilaginibacter glaciei]|uniref:Glycosyltransferase family 2 protein n=1 Tax=Mucilaginibacter glaciei TaxID=2772109 RepID=A0A926NZU2_9SPHI|nr:glycosyltransferase family 2 protein [Mucilaginibacter glaciei]MBD1394714.1 glycosyltransferase family 2 protein [Mucilaginibacter glaciei]
MEKADLKKLSLVSVCVPAYNCEKYISQAIRSVLDQSYPHIEVIIVDDGSTDQTWQELQKFSNCNVILLQQDNRGASVARNKALSVARGKYIQFMDADDILSADKIEAQIQALSGDDDRMAVCSTVHFFEGEQPFKKIPSAYEEQFLYTTQNPVDFMIHLWGGYNFSASMVQPNAWLTPKALIDKAGGWNEQLSLDDDGEFFARMVLNSKGVIKTKGYNYYRKYKQTTQNLASQSNTLGMFSLLKSTLLRNTYLLNKRTDEPALKAAFRQLTELAVQSYIIHPDVYKQVKTELEKLPPYRYNMILGGPLLNTIARFKGWKFAKRIQYLFQHRNK